MTSLDYEDETAGYAKIDGIHTVMTPKDITRDEPEIPVELPVKR